MSRENISLIIWASRFEEGVWVRKRREEKDGPIPTDLQWLVATMLRRCHEIGCVAVPIDTSQPPVVTVKFPEEEKNEGPFGPLNESEIDWSEIEIPIQDPLPPVDDDFDFLLPEFSPSGEESL